MEDLIQEAIDELAVDAAIQTVFDTLEICDVDHKKAFIKGALRSALKGLLVHIIEHYLKIQESFKEVAIPVTTTSKS